MMIRTSLRQILNSRFNSFIIGRNISTSTTLAGSRVQQQSRKFGAFAVGSALVALGSLVYTPPLFAEAPEAKEVVEVEEETIVEPTSKKNLPKVVGNNLQHVGSGVRKVTFLNVQVYILSLYLDETIQSQVKESSLWNNFSVANFNEWFVKNLCRDLKGNIALRIEPIRNTSSTHMLRGFERVLDQRFNQEKDSLLPNDKENIEASIKQFKKEFPNTPNVKKGTEYLFTKNQTDRSLELEIDGVPILKIENEWVSQRFFESFLTTDNPPSEQARQSIGRGLEDILKSS